jgi:hypothetical protein
MSQQRPLGGHERQRCCDKFVSQNYASISVLNGSTDSAMGRSVLCNEIYDSVSSVIGIAQAQQQLTAGFAQKADTGGKNEAASDQGRGYIN